MSKKKQLGQFYTTDRELLETISNFILNVTGNILEPSCGEGHIVKYVIDNKKCKRKWSVIEIDKTIEPLNIPLVDFTHDNFLTHSFSTSFSTIVGNPPYVKERGKLNMYLRFIEKCLELLVQDGELIMIVPSDFLFCTTGSRLRNEMISRGSFTHIHRPNAESLFKGATQDVIVFRYQLGIHVDYCVYNKSRRRVCTNDCILYFTSNNTTQMVKDFFKVRVGMISGRDNVFRHDELGTHVFLSRGGTRRKYILVEEFPTVNNELNKYLLTHKSELMSRRISKMTEKNWFKWGAIRNYDFMKDNPKQCLYIETLTRDDVIARIAPSGFFDGNLLCLEPISNEINLQVFCDYFNSKKFIEYYKQAGRFKMGQKILSNAPVFIDNV